jgi:hypothetical protein
MPEAPSIAVETPDQTKAIVRVDPQAAGMEKAASDDPTPDAPSQGQKQDTAEGDSDAAERMSTRITEGLKQVRRQFLEADSTEYNAYLRRITRAFETFKNNPYILYNSSDGSTDTMGQILRGMNVATDDQIDLYQYNDNIYQMLGLTLIAALGQGLTPTRYQPTDAENEADILIAQKASIIQANNERKNSIEALQKKELLFFWCAGTYFKYTRNVVDANRAGVTRQPITQMKPTEAFPARYICPECQRSTPASQFEKQQGGDQGTGALLPPLQQPGAAGGQPQPQQQMQLPAQAGGDQGQGAGQQDDLPLNCPNCGSEMGDADWHEPFHMDMPQKVAEKITPNSMTAIDVFSGAHVRINPRANELYESKYLDFSGELDLGTVRAAYPGFYAQIGAQRGEFTDPTDQQGVTVRRRITSPSGTDTAISSPLNGTYTRFWVQPEGFNVLDDEKLAKDLARLFPEGAKLVLWGNDLVLDAVPDKMMDHWTQGKTIKGLGAYPFGIGDAALDIQARINDVANTIHAYMDRLAFGTILADAENIDIDRMADKPLFPGNFTEVYRKDESGMLDKPLNTLLFQPEFHIDSHIFEYQPQLIQLAQTIAGVQPQTFGGSDPNVQTAHGQAQMLKQAMGRMKLFWDQIRDEHAQAAENGVRCTVDNMNDQMKIVTQSDVENSYQTIVLLKSQLVGDFMAYPEPEEGLPTSFDEMQQQIMQLLEQAQQNKFLQGVLSEPDTMKLVARYILPYGAKMPGDAERARLKTVVQMLAKSTPRPQQMPPPPQPPPQPGQPPAPPPQPQTILVPSMVPSDDYDDFGMAVEIATTWLQENWQTADSPGFQNVLLWLKVCKQKATVQAVKMQQQAQAALPPPPTAGSGAPPMGHGGPPPPGAAGPHPAALPA